MMHEKTVVVVRPRPLFPSEIKKSCKNVLQHPEEDVEKVLIAGNKIFEYDHVLNEHSNQSEVYTILKPVVQHVIEGFHATVLAYGQTGAGKTYTMGTGKKKEGDQANYEMQGIVPRMIQSAFEMVAEGTTISVSFMEVYLEEAYDLLTNVPTKLQLNGCKVLNLTKKIVVSEVEALKRLDEGIDNRRFCATQANPSSSRSHAIFSLNIETISENGRVSSELHLVDLAGSESIKKTGNQGAALTEGVNINKGLLELGNVIYALGSGQVHVPYRNSTLTKVLKDSLSGKSTLAIIACISPSDLDLSETLNTLRFAQRARKIINMPKMNRILEGYLNIPSTPYNWKIPHVPCRGQGSTPGSAGRRPLAVMNYSVPSPFVTPRIRDKLMLSTISEKGAVNETVMDSPPLPNLSTFEPPRCSSALSFYNNDQDISVMMNTIISEKMDELRKQTENIVERKIQDTLKKMRSACIAPLTSQLHKYSLEPNFAQEIIANSSPSGDAKEFSQNDPSLVAKIRLFQSPHMEKYPALKRCSPRLQTKKDAGTSPGVESYTDCIVKPKALSEAWEQEKTIVESSVVESPVVLKQRKSIRIEEITKRQSTLETDSKSGQEESQEGYIVPDTPESPVLPKRRKSMRIEEIANRQPIINVSTQQCEKIKIKRKSTRLSLKSYRPDSSISSTQLTLSPSMADFLKDMSFNVPSSRRNSVSSIALSDASQQTSPHISRILVPRRTLAHARSARKSLSIGRHGSTYCMTEENSQKNKRQKRKSRIAILEEELMAKSPSQASAQDKHNRKMLQMLNGSMKTLQQLPTVGPKTSFIIFNYRKLNGQFETIQTLENIPGLVKTYYVRFLKANNIVL